MGARNSTKLFTHPNDEEATKYLYRTDPGKPRRAGQVLTDHEHLTFTGRSGLPHPWASRLAILIAVALYPLMIPLALHCDILPLLDAQLQHKILHVTTLLLTILFVYLPASAILSRTFSGRVSVPRRQIVHADRLGRIITLTVSSKGLTRRLILTTETDADASALMEEITAEKGAA